MSRLAELQKAMGFTKQPMNPGDDGSAFIGFLSFATGTSASAKNIQADFDCFHADPAKTSEQNGIAFLDWLIVEHWSEAASPDNTSPKNKKARWPAG